ncbi:unnamed protein product [Pleuronectes platessa]|uniref:Uncharacterized protein n=1 Tax=Pleuronectes platessa TaxID=8262 RepID=A0A9N7VYQ1_PLEPL|nr:unnamed protein product [Pleuronectes platessa]
MQIQISCFSENVPIHQADDFYTRAEDKTTPPTDQAGASHTQPHHLAKTNRSVNATYTITPGSSDPVTMKETCPCGAERQEIVDRVRMGCTGTNTSMLLELELELELEM